jgi:cob(I)alamin adenosyltransferase
MARIVLLTGDGKGKTSSALGMILRAVGHGMRVCLIQFIKDGQPTGESVALERLGVEQHRCGLGFVFPNQPEKLPAHRAAAAQGLTLAVAKLADGQTDVVVLDEVCGALGLGLIPAEPLVTALRSAPAKKIVILTGRGASPELRALADTVSVIESPKHAYERGIPAQKGVEF